MPTAAMSEVEKAVFQHGSVRPTRERCPADPMSGPAVQEQPHEAAELLPLVYTELRHLAARQLAHEHPGQTLQATALVHEAWLRLNRDQGREWNDSRHFFYAAAEAMRRILIENARRKQRVKHGGLLQRVNLDDVNPASPMEPEELLVLDEALERLAAEDPEAARLIELRFFAGLGHQETAAIMGISRRAADGLWAYGRSWLFAAVRGSALNVGDGEPKVKLKRQPDR